jgi:EAL domain-containing protein (putative c-di-GMP-specific phosphodiesterase class I)/DNA-binding response OmpR family regulator
VVEDSPTQAERVRLLLEREGHAVAVAPDGREGLRMALADTPDLIISDVVMPRMDGYAFCQAVKSAEATRRIPFVLLTGMNSPLDVVVGLERGADNFVTKPFEDAQLASRVRRIFENLDLGGGGSGRETIVDVGGRKIAVSADKQQIVELLIAVFQQLGDLSGRLVESERAVEEFEERLAWVERTREALEQDRLVLFYQPILHLRSDRISHHEALLRMVGRDGEVIPPGAFLPLAEKSGMIRQIDRWVVRRAIQAVAEHRREGRELSVAVNLSGRCFRDVELLERIQEDLEAAGADPSSIAFEITETEIIAGMEEAAEFMKALKEMGCRFALDDFGVGFSSLDYLRRLPADYVKIDGSFIRDLPRRDVDQRLVRSIVEMARALNKLTIAEFVGDAETLRLLREYGVDYAQGYHVGRPAAEPRLAPRGAPPPLSAAPRRIGTARPAGGEA